MRNFKKIVAIILSIVMLFCALPVNTLATGDIYPTITVGQVIDLSFTEGITEYIHAFTPTEAGYYFFYSFNNESMDGPIDTCAQLYDSDWEMLVSGDDEAGYSNFKFMASLNANETYYLKSTTFESSYIGTCSVTVEKAVVADSISFDATNLTCFLNYPVYLPIGIMTEPEDSIPGTVEWTINDENIAEFSGTDDFYAEIVPIAVGTTTVTATTEKGATASCEVTVKNPTEITVGSPYIHEFEDIGYNVFSFTPTETAVYEISSTYNQDAYFGFGGHYDSNSNELIPIHAQIYENDITEQIEQYKLEKDITYYFETHFEGVGSYTLNITKPDAATEMYLNHENITDTIGSRYTISRSFGPEGCAYEKTTWSISDESIAQLNFYPEYLGGMSLELRLLKPGTATITATSERGRTATCTLTVTGYDELTLNTTYEYNADGYQTNYAQFTPSETAVYELCFVYQNHMSFSYSLSDTDYNDLNYIYSTTFGDDIIQTGKLQYKLEKDKTYYIKAYSPYLMPYTVSITKPVPAESISLSSSSIDGLSGKIYGIRASFGPEGAAAENIEWSIDDDSIAKITYNPEDSSGSFLNVKLLKAGTATITATSESGHTATCAVTVTEPEEIFTDTTKNGSLPNPNDTVIYKFVAQENGAHSFQINDSKHTNCYFNFHLRNMRGEAILSSDGAFIEEQCILEKGQVYYLEISSLGMPDEFNRDYFINITIPPKAKSMTLWCDSNEIYVNTDINIFTNFYPENSAIEAVEWSIDNTDIAYISSSSYDYAWIFCHTAGTATITATSSSGLTASYTLNIKSYTDAPSLTLNGKTSVPTSSKKSVFQFTPAESGTYAFYSAGNVDTLCNLLDSDMNYITSDSCSGEGNNFYILHNLNAGETYYITSDLYSNYENTHTYDIWLKRLVPATSVRILNGSSAEGYVGNYIKLYAMLNPSNAISEELSWTIDDTSVAYIDGYYDNGGIDLRLNNIGATTVTVTTENGLSDSIEITVKDHSIESIKITQGSSITRQIGENMHFYVNYYPDGYEEIYWTSSNPSVVSIDEYGYAVCKKTGTAIITATSISGLTSSCVITVIPTQTIELNLTKRISVTTSNESATIYFTPKESGYYTFYSISSYDTYGWIDEYTNDDCGTNKNFRVNAYLTAGIRYTLSAGLYANSTGEFDVRLERIDVDTSNGDIDFSGEVDALDLAWMRKLLFGIIPLDSASQDIYDINLDGSFDVRDLVRLKNILSKK